MGRPARAFRRITMTIAVVTTLPVVTTAVEARDNAPAPPRIDWQSCGPDFPGADCAFATVPLDHDNPRAGTTEIALARVPASDQEHRIGTVFVNPGGPGLSGVAAVLFGAGAALDEQLDGRFDIVGFDPRGVANSEPLQCFDTMEDLFSFALGQPIFPYLAGQHRPYFDTWRGLGPECLDDRQRIAAHMSTADVARDLDLLRHAVGDRKLTYLGFSYGSYLGTTYANLFPRNVRAIAIDGVLDPRLWSTGWQIMSDRVATAEVAAEFLRLCDEAGPACAFSSPEGSTARYEQLAAALLAEPYVLPDGFVYTYDLLIAESASAMSAPESWGGPEGAGALLDALADQIIGAQDRAREIVAIRASLRQRFTAPRLQYADEPYDNTFVDAFFGVYCADAEFPANYVTWRAIDVFAAAGSRFGPFWWATTPGCAAWPTNRDRYAGPWAARPSAPVLVVGNRFDGVTGYTGAEATTRLLRDSRLLTYAGWGHTAYGRSACTTEYINAYLVDGSLPPPGTVCPANPNPFLAVAQRTAAPSAPLAGLPATWPGG